jgi:hypothetical protein
VLTEDTTSPGCPNCYGEGRGAPGKLLSKPNADARLTALGGGGTGGFALANSTWEPRRWLQGRGDRTGGAYGAHPCASPKRGLMFRAYRVEKIILQDERDAADDPAAP